jgi:hypothetical protein
MLSIRTGLSVLLLALAPAFAATAGDAPDATSREPVVVEHLMTMPVDGTLLIDTDGSVREYQLATKLVPSLADSLGKAIRNWRFEPVSVDGAPARQEARMRISLAATPEGENYQVRVDNVVFRPMASTSSTDPDFDPGATVQAVRRKLQPPQYPGGLMRQGIGGRVLVALHFSPEGKMIDVVPAQAMLFDTRGKDRDLAMAIRLLEEATVRAARNWTVDVTVKPGRPTSAKDFTTYTTVEFVMDSAPGFSRHQPYEEPAGQWRLVARTPKRLLPWLIGLDAPDVGVADLGNGEMAALTGGPKLKSPVANTLL